MVPSVITKCSAQDLSILMYFFISSMHLLQKTKLKYGFGLLIAAIKIIIPNLQGIVYESVKQNGVTLY